MVEDISMDDLESVESFSLTSETASITESEKTDVQSMVDVAKDAEDIGSQVVSGLDLPWAIKGAPLR